jgi:hypothetical protein
MEFVGFFTRLDEEIKRFDNPLDTVIARNEAISTWDNPYPRSVVDKEKPPARRTDKHLCLFCLSTLEIASFLL